MAYSLLLTGLILISLFIGFVFLILSAIVLSMVSFVVVIFIIFMKTRRVLVPKMTLFVLNLLEDPIAFLLKMFGIKSNTIVEAIILIRNSIFDQMDADILKKDRILFLPYCLRDRECPAKLTEDGLMCIMCGRCDIGVIKREAESLGYKVFIVPGSSLIKKIVARLKPKAIVGVACHSEARSGASKMSASGLPLKGLILEKDGCIDTKVDVKSLFRLLKD